MTTTMVFSNRMEEAFINKNIPNIKHILDLYTIDNIKIFKIAYEKRYLNYDIAKFLIEYFVSKNINIHSNNYYIFNSVCKLKNCNLVKWFIEYCESSNNKIDKYNYYNILYEASQHSSISIVKYLFEYYEMYIKTKLKNTYININIVITQSFIRKVELLKFIIKYYYKHNIQLNINCINVIEEAINCKRIKIFEYLIYLFKHNYIYFDIHVIQKLSRINNTFDLFDKFFNTKNINIIHKYKHQWNSKLKYLYNNNLYCIFDSQFKADNNYINYILILS